MEKKNKKKLFAIIGGSVLAFVLTIALSVSITLAYFGSVTDKTTTVTLGGSVEVGYSAALEGKLTDIRPGELVGLDAGVVVTSSSTQDAYLMACLNITYDEITGVEDEVKTEIERQLALAIAEIETEGGWYNTNRTATKNSASIGTVFLYGTSETAALEKISATETSTDAIPFLSSFVMPETLTNVVADLELDIQVTFVAVQPAFTEAGALEETQNFAVLEELFETVGGITIA